MLFLIPLLPPSLAGVVPAPSPNLFSEHQRTQRIREEAALLLHRDTGQGIRVARTARNTKHNAPMFIVLIHCLLEEFTDSLWQKTLWDLVWLSFPYLVCSGQSSVDMFVMLFSCLEEGNSFTSGGKVFLFSPQLLMWEKVKTSSYCSCKGRI